MKTLFLTVAAILALGCSILAQTPGSGPVYLAYASPDTAAHQPRVTAAGGAPLLTLRTRVEEVRVVFTASDPHHL